MNLIDEQDVQNALRHYLWAKRKQAKLSREKLAAQSGVPAATIKHFETTGQISMKQFLRLWLCLDDLTRLYTLTQAQEMLPIPTTIEEVVKNDL